MIEVDLKKLLSTKEAAQILGCSERKLWNLSAPRGSLQTVRIGQSVRYEIADLKKFIQQCKEIPEST